MRVNAYISREAADYFRGTDLSAVVNDMMESMECSDLPTSGRVPQVHVRVDVDHPDYIIAAENGLTRGGHPQYSISRILEYAYDLDYLVSHQIEMDDETKQIVKMATIRSCARKLAEVGEGDELITAVVETLNTYAKGEQE